MVGRYLLLEIAERGGMGIIYRARDTVFNRDVAIKLLPPELAPQTDFRVRFLRESWSMAALRHSSIVPVYDAGEENGQPFFTMRWMGGKTLAERIDRGKLPLEQIVYITERISSALQIAHEVGIIHRDVKPRNVLFDDFGDAYLSDFGILKFTESSVNITRGLIGVPSYMAPEMIQGPDFDHRVDIYALGVMLYEMLTTKLPYDSTNPTTVMFAHLDAPIPKVSKARPELPKEISKVVKRAMSKRPQRRFQSAQDLAKALRFAAGDQVPGPHHTRKAAELLVSHHVADAALVNPIVKNLRSLGFDVWCPSEEPGSLKNWLPLIEQALDRVDGVLLFLSPKAKDSQRVMVELEKARVHEVPIFPVIVSGSGRSGVPTAITGMDFTDLRSDTDRTKNFSRLVMALTHKLGHTLPRHTIEPGANGMPMVTVTEFRAVEF